MTDRPVLIVCGQPLCTICGQPLSAREIKMKVTAHFPCVFREAFGDGPLEEDS